MLPGGLRDAATPGLYATHRGATACGGGTASAPKVANAQIVHERAGETTSRDLIEADRRMRELRQLLEQLITS